MIAFLFLGCVGLLIANAILLRAVWQAQQERGDLYAYSADLRGRVASARSERNDARHDASMAHCDRRLTEESALMVVRQLLRQNDALQWRIYDLEAQLAQEDCDVTVCARRVEVVG